MFESLIPMEPHHVRNKARAQLERVKDVHYHHEARKYIEWYSDGRLKRLVKHLFRMPPKVIVPPSRADIDRWVKMREESSDWVYWNHLNWWYKDVIRVCNSLIKAADHTDGPLYVSLEDFNELNRNI